MARRNPLASQKRVIEQLSKAASFAEEVLNTENPSERKRKRAAQLLHSALRTMAYEKYMLLNQKLIDRDKKKRANNSSTTVS